MCTRPITIKNPDPQKILGLCIEVPCGKCPECLARRQNDWKLRLMEESSNYSHLYFFTLTYADENLPITDEGLSTACKKDVQLWIKKFRMAFERSKGIKLSDYFKYFICAEYGPNGTHRPHYHGLFMTDLDEVAINPLFDDWRNSKGFVHVDSVPIVPDERQAVANYVSKYCCKGEFASRKEDIDAGKIENAWSCMSKGIGRSYVENPVNRRYHRPFRRENETLRENLDVMIDRMCVSFSTQNGTFTYAMPRYYRERLFQLYQPFERYVYNPKLKKYEKKEVWRYASKNSVSPLLSFRVRERVLDRFAQQIGYAEFRLIPSEVLDKINVPITNISPSERDYRERRARGKLAEFYITNANRWRDL